MTKILLGLLSSLVMVIVWIGLSLIGKVDALNSNFNDYVLKTERRITMIEEYEKTQDIQIKEALARRAEEDQEWRRKYGKN